MNEREEIAAIAADLRAWAAAAEARGWTLDAPESAGHAPVASVSPAEPSAPKDVSRWSEIAVRAREERDPKRLLQQVRDDLGDCRRCPLCKERTNLVFGVGDPEAQLLLVGEGPGYHEDQRGEPFVGEAGEMLDKMLANVLGLSRAEVYILNVVKCRPPKNRAPLPDEVAACRPFLERQIAAIAPKVIVALGGTAFKALFMSNEDITANRGKWLRYQGIDTLPTFHPAYLLRTPADKRLAFEDLKAARQRYDALGGKRGAFTLT